MQEEVLDPEAHLVDGLALLVALGLHLLGHEVRRHVREVLELLAPPAVLPRRPRMVLDEPRDLLRRVGVEALGLGPRLAVGVLRLVEPRRVLVEVRHDAARERDIADLAVPALPREEPEDVLHGPRDLPEVLHRAAAEPVPDGLQLLGLLVERPPDEREVRAAVRLAAERAAVLAAAEAVEELRHRVPRRRGVRPPHVRLDVVGGAGLAVHRRAREGPVADDLGARADDRREEPLGPRVGRAHHVREVVAREPDDVARRLRRAAPPREHLVGDVAEVVRQAREAAHGDREGPVADAERHFVLLDVLLRVLPLGLALLLLLRVVLAEAEHRREEAEDEESRAHLEARPRREARDAADRRAVPPLAERLERPLEVLDRGVGERPPGVKERGEPPLAVEVHRDVAGVTHRVRDVLRVGLAVALRHLAVGRVGGDAGRHLDHRVPVLGELLEAVHPVADVGHRVAPRADAREVAELRGHRPELAVELPLDVREVLRRHAADAPAVLRPLLRVPLDERGPVAVVEHGPRRAERVAGEHEVLELRRARRAEGGVEVPRRLRVVGGPVRHEERRRPRCPQRGEGRGHAAEPVDEPMVDEGLLLEGRADGRCVGAREPPLLDLFL